MRPEFFEQCLNRMSALGIMSFSAYVVLVIRNDLFRRGELRIIEETSHPLHMYGEGPPPEAAPTSLNEQP